MLLASLIEASAQPDTPNDMNPDARGYPGRYRPPMPTVSVAPIVVRTTNEPAGAHPHGIGLGTGAAPEAALEDLVTEAGRRASLLAQEAAEAETGLGDATWSFHVAGVRLTAGPGPEPWAAIGTLVTPGQDPWSGSWAQLRR